MPSNNKTNTGHKDSKGRTIWRGPRGGHFVMNGDRKVSVDEPTGHAGHAGNAGPSRSKTLPWTVLKAAHKFKHGTFEDPITYARVAKKNSIALGQHGHVYSKTSMARWIAGKPPHQQTLPLTREVLTNAERRAILGDAGHALARTSSAGHGHGGSSSWSNSNSNSNDVTPMRRLTSVSVTVEEFRRGHTSRPRIVVHRFPFVEDTWSVARTILRELGYAAPSDARVYVQIPGRGTEEVSVDHRHEPIGDFAEHDGPPGAPWTATIEIHPRRVG